LTEEFNKEKETAAIITKMATVDYPISEIISRREDGVQKHFLPNL
jgi:hypothetical protein